MENANLLRGRGAENSKRTVALSPARSRRLTAVGPSLSQATQAELRPPAQAGKQTAGRVRPRDEVLYDSLKPHTTRSSKY